MSGSSAKSIEANLSYQLPQEEAKKVVVAIDDEKEILKLYQTFLHYSGYEVHTADNAVQGFELIKTKKADLILLDINMPGIDGLTTLKLLRNDPHTKNAVIFMVSARRDEDTVKEAVKLGCDHFLIKPFKFKDLADRLNSEFKSIETEALRSLIKPPLTLVKNNELLREQGLSELSPNMYDSYSVIIDKTNAAIVTLKGLRPELFSRSLEGEMERNVTVYFKFGRRWRKIWPAK